MNSNKGDIPPTYSVLYKTGIITLDNKMSNLRDRVHEACFTITQFSVGISRAVD
jgi:hypothetical protein